MKHSDVTASLPITVPIEVHEEVAAATSEAFAISYLCGAVVASGVLRPRTMIARERLLADKAARHALDRRGLVVGRALSPAEREPLT